MVRGLRGDVVGRPDQRGGSMTKAEQNLLVVLKVTTMTSVVLLLIAVVLWLV